MIGGCGLLLYALTRWTYPHFTLTNWLWTAYALFFYGRLLAKHLLPQTDRVGGLGFGILLFIALQSIFQTGWFYGLGALGATSDTWTMLLSMALSQLIVWYAWKPTATSNLLTPARQQRLRQSNLTRFIWIFLISLCSIGTTAFIFIVASRAATSAAIRTPWPLLPPITLLALALLWISLALGTWMLRSRALTMLQACLALFATTSIAPLVYRLGLGFDGFLHLAGEKMILATGTLNPKPMYYIGQYVFTTWLTRYLGLSIEHVDRWLIPVATALLIPLALYISTSDSSPPNAAEGHDKSFASNLSGQWLGLVLLPLAPFVATTPQSFAYLLGLVAIFLAPGTLTSKDLTKSDLSNKAPLILTVWSITIHPLAGVPFFFVILALNSLPPTNLPNISRQTRWRLARNVVAYACVVAAAMSVPILFYVLSRAGHTSIDWDLAKLLSHQPWIEQLSAVMPWLSNHFVIWPAWASLVLKALPVFLLLGTIGTILAPIAGRTSVQPYCLLLVAGLALLAAALILQTIGTFSFLIQYEREAYADRLNMIALLCWLPAALPFVAYIFNRAKRHGPFFALTLLIFFASIGAAQSANALPRHDALVTGRGWSVGQADLEAVRLIEQDAAGRIYTVLANQSVSAAAVSQFGFKRYNGEIFFYPIPTGGPLYQLFLRLTYPEIAQLDVEGTVRAAGQIGGSSLVYVVINDYWQPSKKVMETLNDSAQHNWLVGYTNNGLGRSVRVYKFDVN